MQTQCPNCSATLTFTQQGTVCQLTCPNCGQRLVATAPTYNGPIDNLDWNALLAPVATSGANDRQIPQSKSAIARTPHGSHGANTGNRQRTTHINRHRRGPLSLRFLALGGLLLSAFVLAGLGIYVGGILQQQRQIKTGTISAGGWSATVAPTESEPRFSAAIGIGEVGQAIYHKVTGSKFSITCFDAPDDSAELNLDEYLKEKLGYEILRTENILRQGLHGVKHTARDLKTGAIAYHELFSVSESKLLLLTYISANDLEKSGGDKATHPSSTETKSIDRPEIFFDSLHPVALW